jgi:hypothetical protein
MMLNLGRYHSSLQAFQDDLAFRDGQPYGGGRQQVLALNGGYSPFNSLPGTGFGKSTALSISSRQLNPPHNFACSPRQSILRLLISCEIYSLTGNDRWFARCLAGNAAPKTRPATGRGGKRHVDTVR